MRRAVNLATVGLLAAASAIAASDARATTGPTLVGPSVVKYFATVRLTGTTPAAGQHVLVYFRRAGSTRFTVHRDLHSDASGRFTVTYRADAGYAYYARVSGAASTTDATRLVSATCATSRPLFPAPTGKPNGVRAFAALTTVRNGLWAGYAFRDYPLEFDAISWRKGQRRATVLARYTHLGTGRYQAAAHGSLDAVGITPTGAVVAAVQRRDNRGEQIHTRGIVFYRGRTYALSSSPAWASVRPLAVTTKGAVIGTAVTSTRSYLVRWADTRARYEVLRSDPRGRLYYLAADAAGDVAMSARSGRAYIRTAAGRTVLLANSAGTTVGGLGDLSVAGGSRFYAHNGGVVSAWDASRPPAAAPWRPSAAVATTGAGRDLGPAAAGVRGDLTLQSYRYDSIGYLRTARGAFVRLPAQYAGHGPAGQAVDGLGTVALTGRDGLVRLVRCR